MTLEKPLLQPARIGDGAEEARWRLDLVNASAPAWRLRGGASGGCGWELVAEAAGSRARSAGKRQEPPGLGLGAGLGGRVLERKARVGPPVSSHHRPNCHSRPSPEGAGPSPPPPGIPRGGGSSSTEGPRNCLLSPVNSSSVEGPSLLTPSFTPLAQRLSLGEGAQVPIFQAAAPTPVLYPPGGQTSLPTLVPARQSGTRASFTRKIKISVFQKRWAKQKSRPDLDSQLHRRSGLPPLQFFPSPTL